MSKVTRIDPISVIDSRRRDSQARGFTVHRTRRRPDGTKFDTIEIDFQYLLEVERRKYG